MSLMTDFPWTPARPGGAHSITSKFHGRRQRELPRWSLRCCSVRARGLCACGRENHAHAGVLGLALIDQLLA